MVRMDAKELDIHRSRADTVTLLSIMPYVTIEGSIRSADIQELNDMFRKGPIYLLTEEEAEEYLALKHEKEVRETETKEEENNEEHN